jgi:hypothetical protein
MFFRRLIMGLHLRPPLNPPTASPAEIQRMQAQRAEAELLRLREAERPIVDPRPQPTVDPVAQKYVNDFNALINQGNYEGAARVVKEAELAGYGDEAYRAAAVILDRNPNLPPELNFLNAEGIQSIRDYVANVTNVDEFNKLIRDEEFGKAAAFAQSQGFTPDQVATYINENAANLGLSEGFEVTGVNTATAPPPSPSPCSRASSG